MPCETNDGEREATNGGVGRVRAHGWLCAWEVRAGGVVAAVAVVVDGVGWVVAVVWGGLDTKNIQRERSLHLVLARPTIIPNRSPSAKPSHLSCTPKPRCS